MKILVGELLFLLLLSCNNSNYAEDDITALPKGRYGYDAAFLKEHTKKTVELSDGESGKILISAEYQGRVMTSTASGDSGLSFGWINYDLIASGIRKKSFNPVGGEERFWLGPEGGQYSIYFRQGDSFAIDKWQVPAIIDTVSFNIEHSDSAEAIFTKKATISNYSGNIFNIAIERKISILSQSSIENKIGTAIAPGVKFIAYQTENKLSNEGKEDWTKEKGLLSIWLLGMFTPTPETVVIIPFSPVKNANTFITDNYFGSIPPGRLQVKDSVLFFTCDGRSRSKIGLSPVIAKPLAAGFDFKNNVLTLIIPEIHKNASYVNSKWEMQTEPYKGDVINSYNDGPLADGTQMGPFFEIESSSPALQLKKGETGSYRQTTIHLQGTYAALKKIAQALLNTDLDNVRNEGRSKLAKN